MKRIISILRTTRTRHDTVNQHTCSTHACCFTQGHTSRTSLSIRHSWLWHAQPFTRSGVALGSDLSNRHSHQEIYTSSPTLLLRIKCSDLSHCDSRRDILLSLSIITFVTKYQQGFAPRLSSSSVWKETLTSWIQINIQWYSEVFRDIEYSHNKWLCNVLMNIVYTVFSLCFWNL